MLIRFVTMNQDSQISKEEARASGWRAPGDGRALRARADPVLLLSEVAFRE